MLVPIEWLIDYVDFDLSPDALADLLTMAGLEVDETRPSDIGAVLDVKVTPNRGDCLSIVGLAREIIAKMGGSCRPTPLWSEFVSGFGAGRAEDTSGLTALTSVELLDPNLCPRYAARVIRNPKITASPTKVQLRLEAAGVRCINNVVDATNYVLLELGQPLHAFDMDKLEEHRIVVRQARAGERLTTLDGVERDLAAPTLVICDATRPVAVAGVMGGAETEVTDRTSLLLLESAHFSPQSVRRTRKLLGLQTEAAYRFERFVDPNLVLVAAYRCSSLLAEWCGADVVPGCVDVCATPAANRTISLRGDRIDTILGTSVADTDVRDYLERLGFGVQADGERRIQVTVPTFRSDIVREDDLVEEVGRIHGYDRIPEESLAGQTVQGQLSPELAFAERVRTALLRCGLMEVVNHSLTSPGALQAPDGGEIALRNPMSPEYSVLRSSLLPGVTETAARNARRGMSDLAIFELGHIFMRKESESMEESSAAYLLMGAAQPPHWAHGKRVREFDFYDCKGIAEQAMASLGLHDQEWQAGADDRFHPGRSATLIIHDVPVGRIGELHPAIVQQYDLPKRAYVGVLYLPEILRIASYNYRYRPVPKFPPVHRDIAFVIDRSVPWSAIAHRLSQACGNMLEGLRLFDIYVGQGIPDGKHSLAVALTLRKHDGTLTEDEISMCVSSALTRLQDELGATLRT